MYAYKDLKHVCGDISGMKISIVKRFHDKVKINNGYCS